MRFWVLCNMKASLAVGLWTGSSSSELRLQGQFCSRRPAQCKPVTYCPTHVTNSLLRFLSRSYTPAKTTVTVLLPSEPPKLFPGATRLPYKASLCQNQPSRAELCPLSNSFKLANVTDLPLQSSKQQADKMVWWVGRCVWWQAWWPKFYPLRPT